MKLHQFEEPQLEFGAAAHVDIRYGVTNYGPFDIGQTKRPEKINIGIIGTQQTTEELHSWIEKCETEVPPEAGRSPTRRNPVFPGFSSESPFRCKANCDSSLAAIIRPSEFQRLKKIKNLNERIAAAVEVYNGQVERLKGKGAAVVLCTLPVEILDLITDASKEVEDEDVEAGDIENVDGEDAHDEAKDSRWNFHDLLKAKSMRHQIPIQLIRPSTWDRNYISKEPDRKGLRRQLQDEALRAWNFFSAVYYKASGCPWRLPRPSDKLNTCYVGISFYRTLEQNKYRTSLAQVFDELGSGIVVRGGEVKISSEDKQPHLDAASAKVLLLNALDTYRSEHHHYPAQIVVYKTTRYNEAELDGFKAAAEEKDIDFVRFLSVSRSTIRLYRDGYFPPLRGTCLEIDAERMFLYTKGTIPFYEMYPGPYIPRTLLVRREGQHGGATEDICREILALSKMNWNNTQLDGFEPLPVRAAREVGSILKYCAESDPVAPFYRHYM